MSHKNKGRKRPDLVARNKSNGKGRGWTYSRYGVILAEYKRRMDSADTCLLCGLHFIEKHRHPLSKVYDHNHQTNRFRGVIHRNCNMGLGIFNDDPAMLRSAVSYLESK